MEKLYIGVDLGGTSVKVGIVKKNGEILKKLSNPTNLPQPEEVIEDKICKLCLEICDECGIDIHKDIEAIGIGSPGNVNNKTGVIGFSSNFGYNDWHLKEKIEAKLGVKVEVENDANAAIIAEVNAGCAKGCPNAVILTLGTGVGSGVIINGKIYGGYNKSGAEMGHMVISVGGRECNCGRKGCFEKYASASALVYDTKVAMLGHPKSLLWKICPDINEVTSKTVFDAMEQGDKIAQKVFDSYIEYLACGITNIVNIFQPEILCLGGGISNQKDVLLKPLQEYLDREDYARGLNKRVKIKIADFRNDAGIIGAALVGVNNAR